MSWRDSNPPDRGQIYMWGVEAVPSQLLQEYGQS